MKILLHICCSNCALYPIKILNAEGHDLTGFWFNPNIHPLDEYRSRLDSVKKLEDLWHIDILYNEEYKPEEYFEIIKSPLTPLYQRGEYKEITHFVKSNNSELIPPLKKGGGGGFIFPPSPVRCASCYMLRLEKTAMHAGENGFDAFSTTLLISPYQDFEKIADTGKELEERYNVSFHLKDFRPYFRDAMALSKELGLYRQKYCGCIYSKEERKIQKGPRIQGAKGSSK